MGSAPTGRGRERETQIILRSVLGLPNQARERDDGVASDHVPEGVVQHINA
ncbi:hypothetical protein M1D93_20320 (plasmid) [Arthrobacter sp. Z1-9]